MKVTILGSGTSHGVPVIGCNCDVCRSTDPRNNRTRSSLWIETVDRSIVVDTSTDFREQALRSSIDRLDAVIYTHAHADHLHGLDDTRSLTRDNPIPLFAARSTASEIRKRFDYIFRSTQKGGGKPLVFVREIDDEPFEIGSLLITPIPIRHGDLDIYGYRFDMRLPPTNTREKQPKTDDKPTTIASFAYVTDCSDISDESYDLLDGVELLIIGALRYRPHATHFSIDEAVAAAQRVDAGQTYLTHMCHDVEHATLESQLPESIHPAFDGMSVNMFTL